MEDSPAIGHNKPPKTAFEIHQDKINELYDEAKTYLDGEPVDRDDLAGLISTLLRTIQTASKDAEKERAIEKEPFLTAGREIDARWKTLSELCNRATAACKDALKPWLVKAAAEKAAADKKAQELADAKLAEAQRVIRETEKDNLLAREEAEAALKDANISKAIANKNQRATAGIKTGAGRAVSLRTVWTTELVDATEALEHYWPSSVIEDCLLEMAKVSVRNGKREIPGFKITEEKVAL